MPLIIVMKGETLVDNDNQVLSLDYNLQQWNWKSWYSEMAVQSKRKKPSDFYLVVPSIWRYLSKCWLHNILTVAIENLCLHDVIRNWMIRDRLVINYY